MRNNTDDFVLLKTYEVDTVNTSVTLIMADALKAEGNKLFAAKDFEGAA